MNFGKIFDLITKNDLNPDDVFNLIEKVRTLDLDNEDNLRKVIREVATLTHKQIDQLKEDMIVNKIKSNGINDSLIEDIVN